MSKFINRIQRRYRAEGGYSDIIRLATPLILSSGSWALMHFVDRMFLAWDSPESLAASGPAGIFSFTVSCILIGTASYVSAFTAQYTGAGQNRNAGKMLWQALYFALFSGIALALICYSSASALFGAINHEPAIKIREIEYFRALALGMPASIFIAALSGFLSGIGRTWPVLMANIIINGVNIVLDYILIFGGFDFPAMGIKGAGIATSIAGWTGVAVFVPMVFNKEMEMNFATRTGKRFDYSELKRLLRYGIPSGMTLFIDIMGFAFFTFLIGKQGVVPLAATNMAFNVNSLAFMPMVGMGSAITVLVGQFAGAGRHSYAERTVYSACHMALSYLIVVALLYWFLPSIFIAPFAASNSDVATFKEVSALGTILLKFVAVYSIFDAFNIAFGSALRGAGDTRFVTALIASLSIVFFIVPSTVVLMILKKSPLWGWTIITVYCCALGTAFFIRFRSGVWKKYSLLRKEKV